MTALKQLCVVYENNQRAYFPGQTLCGHLCLDSDQPLSATKIDVVVRGVSHVKWSEQNGQNRVTYKNKETLVDHTVTVWDKTQDKSHLQAGKHSFPFTFRLPSDLPSSFELFERGVTFIRYWVMATVELESTRLIKYKRPFTVIQHIDVNNPVLLVPMRSENEKTICCLCCRSGSLNLSASIDRAGYCPGETIQVSALTENLTRKVMTGIRAQLVAFTIRKENGTATGIGSVREVVSELMGDPVEVGAADKWENRPMMIPACPPSIEGCRFIKRLYYVQVCVVVPSGITLKIHFPILMGTLPLGDMMVQPSDQHTLYINKTDGIFSLPEPIAIPQVTTAVPLTPPSYVEATRFTVNIAENDDNDTMGDLNYSPLLPFARAGLSHK